MLVQIPGWNTFAGRRFGCTLGTEGNGSPLHALPTDVSSQDSSTFTFWRFAINIPLGRNEMKVHYSINSGQQLEFHVPGVNENMRWAAHSVWPSPESFLCSWPNAIDAVQWVFRGC